jgi:hypothetical protein
MAINTKRKPEEKEVTFQKTEKVDIEPVNLDRGLVGGKVLFSDRPDGHGWVSPYDVVEEASYDYMRYCQVMGFMHGDLTYFKKFLSGMDGVNEAIDEDGKKLVAIDMEELEKSMTQFKKNLDFELPGDSNYGSIVASMFFSKEIMQLLKDEKIVEGDWYAIGHVTDDRVINLIKEGKIKAWSPMGKAILEKKDE